MNKENLQKVIDCIKKRKSQFDMNHEVWVPDERVYYDASYDPNICGTSCCILGWANAVRNDFKPMPHEAYRDIDNASAFLDLPEDFVYALCYPGSDGTSYFEEGKSEELKPWVQANKLELIDISSFPESNCYRAPASAAIAVLEGIRDGIIRVPSVTESTEE